MIDTVLGAIWNQFYLPQPAGAREFARDQRALTKALARYGRVCAQRGWDLRVEFILGDLLALLNALKRQGTEHVKWFPLYLQHAVDRRVRQRAEELRAESLRNQGAEIVAGRVIEKLPAPAAATAREPRAVDVLALLHTSLAGARKQRRAAAKQTSLKL